MLRAFMIALPALVLAGVGAYVVVLPGDHRNVTPPAAAEQPFVAEQSSVERAQAAEPVIRLARVPFPPRNVTPPGIYTGPVRRSEPPPEPEPVETAPQPTTRSFQRVVVNEAGVLDADDTRIRLHGISAPASGDTCTDSSGNDWPCGRAAVAALRLLIRSRPVHCEIFEESGDGLAGDCRLGNRDLGAWLVEHGWAEPSDGSRLQSEFETARNEERGMFAGRSAAAPPVAVPTPTSMD